MQDTSTRSPGRDPRTSSPISTISPTASWPSTVPGATSGTSPLRMCRSVPQIVTASTRTTASVGVLDVRVGDLVPRGLSGPVVDECLHGCSLRRMRPAALCGFAREIPAAGTGGRGRCPLRSSSGTAWPGTGAGRLGHSDPVLGSNRPAARKGHSVDPQYLQHSLPDGGRRGSRQEVPIERPASEAAAAALSRASCSGCRRTGQSCRKNGCVSRASLSWVFEDVTRPEGKAPSSVSPSASTAVAGSPRRPRRPSVSARSGGSSAMSSSFLPPARSAPLRKPQLTDRPVSNTSWGSAPRRSMDASCTSARISRADARRGRRSCARKYWLR